MSPFGAATTMRCPGWTTCLPCATTISPSGDAKRLHVGCDDKILVIVLRHGDEKIVLVQSLFGNEVFFGQAAAYHLRLRNPFRHPAAPFPIGIDDGHLADVLVGRQDATDLARSVNDRPTRYAARNPSELHQRSDLFPPRQHADMVSRRQNGLSVRQKALRTAFDGCDEIGPSVKFRKLRERTSVERRTFLDGQADDAVTRAQVNRLAHKSAANRRENRLGRDSVGMNRPVDAIDPVRPVYRTRTLIIGMVSHAGNLEDARIV